MRRYLLGNLTAKETEQLDLQVISDPSLEEKLNLAEHALIEDYLEKALTAEEKKLFQQNFLVSDRRENQVRELSLLKSYAQSVGEAPDRLNKTTGDGFWQNFLNLFALNLRPATAVLGLLLIGFVAFAAWQVFYRNSLTPLESEYAALNRKDFQNVADFQQYAQISLSSGTFRSSNGASAKTKAENLTESVFFRLALPAQTNRETRFQAELLKDGKPVFTQKEIRPYENENGQEIRLLLPKSVFAKGQYQIRLQDASNAESTVNYNFAVE